MGIIIKSLSYIHSDRVLLFSGISLSVVKGQKAALVGDNGTGKSTLLRVIAGELTQSAGDVAVSEKPYYVPQHMGQFDEMTIAEALGIDKKIAALHAIVGGDASADNFADLNDDWGIEGRVEESFAYWEIAHLKPNQQMKSLSGGEKTKVFLAGIQILSPQVILLDEPTNHLDSHSRTLLYDFVKGSKHTILCVGHDRTLLNLFDTTLELTAESVAAYGGNYEFYRSEKNLQLQALQRELSDKEKVVRQSIRKAQEMIEVRQKQEARGNANASKGVPRIVANGLKRKAENSSAKIKSVHDDRVKDMSEDMSALRTKIQRQSALRVDLKTSGLHKGKVLVEAKGINFSYGTQNMWDEPLTLLLRSGDRMAIDGANGTGKTTLVKILTGTLQPTQGEVLIGDFRCLYIDQDYSMIDNAVTIIEQVQRFNNRNMAEHDVKMMLHTHNFPKETWGKKCASLSGGERMKLILCCAAISNNAPDMIILDEPTNNLDIQSQKILTEAVKDFDGTILLISHDSYFRSEIGVEDSVVLRRGK